jgi:tRNA (guanine-N7-)-methyltransferase
MDFKKTSSSTASVLQNQIIYPLPSILERIDYPALFSKQQPVEVELGSGDGSFLVNYAAARADRNFIGTERLLGRLRKIQKKGVRQALANLRAIRIENVYFLRYLVPLKSVAALHAYFPDPWPKRRHRHNRLINEEFPALARNVLDQNGVVYLRTDDRDYFAQMGAVFDSSPLFEAIETPTELLVFKTDFERDFNARGIPTLAAAYQVRQ